MVVVNEEVPRLAEPFMLGNRLLRNRVISSPMERNLATETGLITPEYIRYLEARAAGGTALIFTESSYVRADGKARRLQMGIHDDSTVPPLRELSTAIHRHGALLGVELNHGGRTAQGAVNGLRCVAPSAVPCEVAGGEVPEPLHDDDIWDIIRCYADAAKRCEAAGVDVIMLHGAHGYLIHQFMSPRTNRRNDEWASPAKFLSHVIEAVREAVPTATLGIRISAIEGPPDGLDAAETLDIVSRAPLDLLDFLDISAGSYEAGEWIVQPGEWAEGVLGDFAQPYQQFGLPVSVVGRITKPETAERILRSGQADLVTVGRALHADPRWTDAAVSGLSYRPCISTNHCIDSLFTGEPVPCSVNPHTTGPPDDSRADLADSTIVVAGGGPAGLEAARRCATRGANVVLFEREHALGGQVRLSAGLRTYPGYHRIIDWYEAELGRLPVDVRLGTAATVESIMALRPAAVVIATGGHGAMPAVAGIQSPRVHEVRDWLRRGAPDMGDQRHVVWGADREGVAIADELLHRGKQLLIVGGQASLAPDVGRRAKILTVPRLGNDTGVETMLESQILSISVDRLEMKTRGETIAVPDSGPVLVSQGLVPTAALAESLSTAGYRGPLHVIGDASGSGGDIGNAIAGAAGITGSSPQMLVS